jgi:hypothetical protein
VTRGDEDGLTREEIAICDTLADNRSAIDILGNDQPKIIAHDLLQRLKASATIDRAHRARLRVLVKRILRKYGDLQDLEDAALRGVPAQAETILSEAITWHAAHLSASPPSTNQKMGPMMGSRANLANYLYKTRMGGGGDGPDVQPSPV